jgi:hypothetical protein
VAERIHTYPVVSIPVHVTRGFLCWCQPSVLEICAECDEHEDGKDPDCWRCGGDGTVPCADPDSYDGPHGLIILHRDV